jgi:hypothetical protein
VENCITITVLVLIIIIQDFEQDEQLEVNNGTEGNMNLFLWKASCYALSREVNTVLI